MSRRQIVRRCALLLMTLVLATAADLRLPGPVPAGASHADTVETSGLGGLVASATGYTTPGPDALACMGHEALACPAAGQPFPASIPPEVAGLVAGNVTP